MDADDLAEDNAVIVCFGPARDFHAFYKSALKMHRRFGDAGGFNEPRRDCCKPRQSDLVDLGPCGYGTVIHLLASLPSGKVADELAGFFDIASRVF